MGRPAKLGKKNGYWHSEVAGVSKYFGKIEKVSRGEAMRLFYAALAGVDPQATPVQPEAALMTVAELAEKFQAWVYENRAAATASYHRLHLNSWVTTYGSLAATAITEKDLIAYRKTLEASGKAPDYVRKHVITIRMMYRRGIKLGLLPIGFQPFANIENPRIVSQPQMEGFLLKREEIAALFATPAWGNLGAMLQVYHATGARTTELAAALVADFQPRARQIVLGRHKRSHSIDQPRAIFLNGEAYRIVETACAGREPSEPIFPRPAEGLGPRTALGTAWTKQKLCLRFKELRQAAGVRDSVTIYSFRHLWISEMLIAGVDILLVAKMAGTSVTMIEKVYGHFRASSFQDAQARLDAIRAHI